MKKVFTLVFAVAVVCFFSKDAFTQQGPNKFQDIDPNILLNPNPSVENSLPPPALTIDGTFCNDGAGIPYNVTDCQGFIAAEDGGADIIYILSVYYDAASPTPYQAPVAPTFIDLFDAADNYLLIDANFYDCNATINPLPTVLTLTSDSGFSDKYSFRKSCFSV